MITEGRTEHSVRLRKAVMDIDRTFDTWQERSIIRTPEFSIAQANYSRITTMMETVLEGRAGRLGPTMGEMKKAGKLERSVEKSMTINGMPVNILITGRRTR